MRFKLGDKTYETAGLDEVSLRDLVLFNTQAAEIGLASRWSDVEAAAEEFDSLTEEEVRRHPDNMLVMAVTIWITRRAAGEDLSFGDAIDIPISKIEILPDPGDHKPGKPRGAKKPRKASAPAVSLVGDDETEKTPALTESESPSTVESSA